MTSSPSQISDPAIVLITEHNGIYAGLSGYTARNRPADEASRIARTEEIIEQLTHAQPKTPGGALACLYAARVMADKLAGEIEEGSEAEAMVEAIQRALDAIAPLLGNAADHRAVDYHFRKGA